jgi:hypothetical protein
MTRVRGRLTLPVARLGLCLATLATLGIAARAAEAGPFELITGWEGDSHVQGYGFVSVRALIPAGAHLTVPLGASGSFLYYTYDSSGASIRVRSPGVSLLTGLRVAGSDGSVSVLGGGEIRRERRETGDPTLSTREETNGGFIVQAEADLALARRWRALALANYAGAARYTYGRGAIRYQASNLDWQGPRSLFLGVEGVRQGNDESDAFQFGGFVECSLVPEHLSLALRSGYKESWSPGEVHRRGGYLGLSAYRAF